MASNSMRAIYKTKMREDNTISTRRMSRGLERRKNREDEVNKRRLLSDDMSPVIETSLQDLEEKPVAKVHQKASSRLDRLKQWREEKKRKVEKDKKESKKPTFKVSPLKHTGESNLYKRTESNVEKPGAKNGINVAAKLAAVNNNKPNASKQSSKVDVKPVNTVRSTRAKEVSIQASTQKSAPAPGIFDTRSSKISQATKTTSTRSTRQTSASKPATKVDPPVVQKAAGKRGKITDLSTKLTASSAAKTKTDLEKPKEFLRAKSRATRITTQNKKQDNVKKSSNTAEQQKEVQAAKIDEVEESTDLDVAAASEQDQNENLSDKELHLSDSAVSSPRHSTPAPRKSTRIKRESEQIKLESDDLGSHRISQRLNKSRATPCSSRRNLSAINVFDEGNEKENSFHSALDKVDDGNVVIETAEVVKTTSSQDIAKEEIEDCVSAEVKLYSQDNKDIAKEEIEGASTETKLYSLDDKDIADEKIGSTLASIKTRRNGSRKSSIAVSKGQYSPKANHSHAKFVDSEKDVDVLDMSDKENVVCEKQTIREKVLRKSSSRFNLEMTDGARQKRKSQRLSTVNNEATDDLQTPAVGNSSRTSRSKSHIKSIITCSDAETEGSNTPATAKRSRRSTIKNISLFADAESCPTAEQAKTELPVIEYSKPKSQPEVNIGSALAKRKSVRISGLVPSGASNNNYELVKIEVNQCPESETVMEDGKSPTTARRSRKSTVKNISSFGESETVMEDGNTPSTAKRSRKSIIKNVSLFTESVMEDGNTPSTAKQSRKSIIKNVSSVANVEADPTAEQADTELPVVAHSKPKLQPEAKIGSALAKRKSVRIAGFVSSDTGDMNLENDEIETTRYPKTPRFNRRQSARTILANQESPRSTFVSVSDEGTSDVIGDNVIGEMKRGTPRHVQHTPVPGKSAKQRRSVRRSEVIDVSNEGTSLSSDHDQNTVYQVPLDESIDGAVSVESISPSKCATISAADAEVMTDGFNTTSAAGVSDESNQSTQPFTPRRSSDMSKATLSPAENQTTPRTPSTQNSTASKMSRSRRSRGLFMNVSFKTPGEPVSALRTRSQRKKRRTEESVSIKSPEEMIEILKKSPMVEMTRRRSRHVPSPGTFSLDTESISSDDTSPCNTVSEATGLPISEPSEQATENLNGTGDIKHFRDLLVSETDRLSQLCNKWNEVVSCTQSLDEEALGQILSTIGKAQLLMDQRFKQFSGLVDNCEFSLGEKETTLTDLQGFWEMIYFQVVDVNQLFAHLTELQQNNWDMKESCLIVVKPKRKLAKINKPKIKSNFAAFRDELIRRKGQATVKSTPASEEDSGLTKTFDAGFFHVKSPVKSPAVNKSQQSSPLTPVVSDVGQSSTPSQDNFTQVVEKPTNIESEQQISTPLNQSNKENTGNASIRRPSSIFPKRLSYLPVVPSPLLNDITGLVPKKS